MNSLILHLDHHEGHARNSQMIRPTTRNSKSVDDIWIAPCVLDYQAICLHASILGENTKRAGGIGSGESRLSSIRIAGVRTD